jgi:uncharacterized protein (DUF1697 family)
VPATPTTYLAFPRAINLAGHNRIGMSELRDLLARLGFTDVRSWLQSGNLIFRGPAQATSALERLLQKEAEARLSLRTDFFVRTAAEWKAIIAGNPFAAEAKADPAHLVVMVLGDPPTAPNVKALQVAAADMGREVMSAVGRQLYIVYPDGIGRSRLTTALIERKLATRGSARNWNTVLKLGALVAG